LHPIYTHLFSCCSFASFETTEEKLGIRFLSVHVLYPLFPLFHFVGACASGTTIEQQQLHSRKESDTSIEDNQYQYQCCQAFSQQQGEEESKGQQEEE
jgi:hypothetical protein